MRALMKAAVAAVAVLGLAGCSATDSSPSPSSTIASHAPVTLTVWVDHQNDAQVQALTEAAARVHDQDPNLSITIVRNKSEQDMVSAIKSLQPPDIYISQSAENVGSYCYNGTTLDLGPMLTKTGTDATKIFPDSVLSYTVYNTGLCAFPMTADPLVLYYRQDMLNAAGIDGPPHTLSELATDLEKLTVRNSDGSIDRWGFTPPVVEYGDNADMFIGGQTGVQFYDAQNKTSLASDQAWPEILSWQQGVLSYYGTGQIDTFLAGHSGQAVSDGPFVHGASAMEIGRASDLGAMSSAGSDVKVAAVPVPDSHADIYGAGSITGEVAYIPSGTDHESEAFELLTDLAQDDTFMTDYALAANQVPATNAVLNSGQWKAGGHSTDAILGQIVRTDNSFYKTPEPSAPQDRDSWIGFIKSWEHGDIIDLTAGLSNEAKTIESLNALANE